MTDIVQKEPARVPWPAVIVYIIVALGLGWLVALPLWVSGDGLASPWAPWILRGMMFAPTIAMLVAVFAMRTPRTGRLRFLGMWPLRPTGRFIGMLVVALFAPIVVVVVTTCVAAVLGLVRVDLVNFSGYAQQLQALAPGQPLPPMVVLVIVQLVMIPGGALVNSIFTAGEELGWRGWLLPALRPLGTWPAIVLTGIVWGVWHAPVILLGYDFGRTDVVGVLLMIGACVAWGALLGWLRLRSASVWPAVLAHGSLNAVGGLILLLVAAGEQPDLAIVGPLGVISWCVLAVFVVLLALCGQFRNQPSPGEQGMTRTARGGRIGA
ncbi:type II CAAX endopeptidase family protein [Microbacterium horticulturae]|uniref:Type II CAAX endopeptidase family protein n=1 Tax=Microbacterium horticulturae TaxID=3028316 RepID=A0ABY8BTV2_9MICO|nr:type II CAAX endopeptidase family protein [Microbacterium sp. KACC 23027]WEG07614.1 type II CAAX endopeptidase family protein [Microbacterium sp. KACC 23027]